MERDTDILFSKKKNDVLQVEKTAEIDEKGPEKAEDGAKWHRYERSQHFVQRSVRLPEVCDTDKMTARYENGVLKLDVPKKKEEKKDASKRVKIQ